jgi:hypothetical protein
MLRLDDAALPAFRVAAELALFQGKLYDVCGVINNDRT